MDLGVVTDVAIDVARVAPRGDLGGVLLARSSVITRENLEQASSQCLASVSAHLDSTYAVASARAAVPGRVGGMSWVSEEDDRNYYERISAQCPKDPRRTSSS